MAEPLKNHFDSRVPRRIARAITDAWPAFHAKAFLGEVLEGFEALELMERGRHIARVLRRHLPDDYPRALEILLRSVAQRPDGAGARRG